MVGKGPVCVGWRTSQRSTFFCNSKRLEWGTSDTNPCVEQKGRKGCIRSWTHTPHRLPQSEMFAILAMASRHPGILILRVSPSYIGISILHGNVVVCGDQRIHDVAESLQLLTGTFPPEESPWVLTGIFPPLAEIPWMSAWWSSGLRRILLLGYQGLEPWL